MKILNVFVFSFLIVGQTVFAQEMSSAVGLAPEYIEFIKAEQSNSYKPKDSTVNDRFRGGLEAFKVGYLEMPVERLNIEIASHNESLVRDHFFVQGSKKGLVRFFIHPESEHLYRPLINEFGYKGYYLALPTASTRTVLAWDPARPNLKPIFLKLSLAKIQDRLGRIVPGWEVRRSVRITGAIDSDIQSGRIQKTNTQVIPEVAGTYIKSSEGLSFTVDQDQGEVSEHGYLIRDASFIEKFKNKRVVPMFWLFSRSNGQEPPIIGFWKKSEEYETRGSDSATSFALFLEKHFFRPFIRLNLPLMLSQGIVPQIHGQNVILVLDPKTNEIEQILHRDIGSMKVDYKLRWLQGLPIDRLRSPYADKDFGLSWGSEKIEDYHLDYLHDWLLRWAYLGNIRRHIKDFDPDVTRKLVKKILSQEIGKLTNSNSNGSSSRRKIETYIESNTPNFESAVLPNTIKSDLHLRTYLAEREVMNQSTPLPELWQAKFSAQDVAGIKTNKYAVTSYGIIYAGSFLGRPNKELRIAFFDGQEEQRLFTSPLRNTQTKATMPRSCSATYH